MKPAPITIKKNCHRLQYAASGLCLLFAYPIYAEEAWELTGFIKNETAWGIHSPRDIQHSEWSMDLFANYYVNDDTTLHLQPRLYYDATWDYYTGNDPLSERLGEHKALRQRYQHHRLGTAAEFLREAYIDHHGETLDLRIGKQQVVWGTADGIKLLDIVNPSDLRELFQNTFEDFRVTLWMVNADLAVGENSSLQALWVPEVRANQVPGLDQSGDVGHPFVFKGIDSITGPINGFVNLAPRLGALAAGFNQGLMMPNPVSAANQTVANTGILIPGVGFNPLAEDVIDSLGLPTEAHQLALLSAGDGKKNSMFEFLAATSFQTILNFGGLNSTYRRNYPDHIEDSNFGLRWKSNYGNTTYSLNYYYHWSNNPSVNLSYESGGRPVVPQFVKQSNASGAPISVSGFVDADGNVFSGAQGHPSNGGDPNQVDPITLVFTEELHRVHSIGASFDTAFDFQSGPIVLRGEFLYDRNDRAPVVDFGFFGIGDLASGLVSEKVDMVKYVIGADKNFFEDLFVSLQFIQFVNLDHRNAVSRATDSEGNPVIDPTTGQPYRNKHVDASTLHLDNGFRSARKYKSFGSLFLSSDFLNEQLRASNLLLYSDEGGYWDQLIVSYEADDHLSYDFESNFYFGDEDDPFGQFHQSSSIRLGVKYSF